MNSGFPDWLNKTLKERGWSDADLARQAKIGSGTLSDIRSGRRRVGPELAQAIAEALKIPYEEVYQEAGIMPKPKTLKDRWIKRIEKKLGEITDENDRRIIEGLVDLLNKKK